jgi:hypothetical protein
MAEGTATHLVAAVGALGLLLVKFVVAVREFSLKRA